MIRIFNRSIWGGGFVLILCAQLGNAYAKGKEVVLYSFPNGKHGDNPESALIADTAGNLYGTAAFGGSSQGGRGDGMVFKLAPDGTQTALHIFKGVDGRGKDGSDPVGALIADTSGNLYGTTYIGGTGNGTVFKLAADGTETVLHTFRRDSNGNCKGGANPAAAVLADSAGNLYGTTEHGGNNEGVACYNDVGVIYKLAPDGKETVLYTFTGGSDGANPAGSLIADSAGNLYGTTLNGGRVGCNQLGCGTVFKLAPNGTETVLHSFGSGRRDGVLPEASLIADSAGNLYGTTFGGGGTACGGLGCGTVFKLAPNGTETILHTFKGNDGAEPDGALIVDTAGNLYGTTIMGGSAGSGTVFKLAPDGTETVLHAFKNVPDGSYPEAALIIDSAGKLYGTTQNGGLSSCGCGTVFEIAP